jgi:hypothetical protein
MEANAVVTQFVVSMLASWLVKTFSELKLRGYSWNKVGYSPNDPPHKFAHRWDRFLNEVASMSGKETDDVIIAYNGLLTEFFPQYHVKLERIVEHVPVGFIAETRDHVPICTCTHWNDTIIPLLTLEYLNRTVGTVDPMNPPEVVMGMWDPYNCWLLMLEAVGIRNSPEGKYLVEDLFHQITGKGLSYRYYKSSCLAYDYEKRFICRVNGESVTTSFPFIAFVLARAYLHQGKSLSDRVYFV